jgi:uncharacterized protein (DUF849 family)
MPVAIARPQAPLPDQVVIIGGDQRVGRGF